MAASGSGSSEQLRRRRFATAGFVLAAVFLVSACSTRGLNRAPVEDRGAGMNRPLPGVVDSSAVKPLPGAENAGKPGYYTVKPGDTLIRIGLDTGQNYRDIGRWSNLENLNLIEVGQVLRVVPPVEATGVVVRPVTSSGATAASPATVASAPVAAASAPKPAATASSSAPTAGEDDVAWIWPVQGAGTVLAGFDEAKNKGLDIAGKAGDAVIASADGRVVYAGAGLRGYGNLVILKHNNTFLTAYAHNQALLVKEDQTVRKGQKIAEMGSTDADRVKLHFEIRRQGKPVDPARYLPAK
ncbi:MAG TPA: peptidoglycan DD-metalloendopeptidase family protein [Polaromonas sp.]|uniref:peptidoglycan DD-metalloendopeptidase family protein n=1 Tax=Polaromonas sp. TaxID=1869339 RepID=UPI002D609961|nr:peptidoglycan DD-metalloendopeptidase family protein [Polaromonas sp.]